MSEIKPGLDWTRSILQEIDKNFPNKRNAKANITYGVYGDLKDKLVFSFLLNNEWISFGLTEEDLKKTPEELVKEVVDDVNQK